jgi:hypothetical protein
MPYIPQERRRELDDVDGPDTAGELNYAITKLILRYLTFKDECYQTYNDIIGALECCKSELYRL